MEKIKLGSKKFILINIDKLQRYESYQLGTILASFIMVPMVLGITMLSIKIYRPLLNVGYIIFIMVFSVFILFFTGLFKKKIIINRKEKTFTSYIFFNVSKKLSSFFSLSTRRMVTHGSGGTILEYFLSDSIIKNDTLKIKYRDFIKFSADDENFIQDLDSYMFYKDDGNNYTNIDQQLWDIKIPDEYQNMFYLRRANYYIDRLDRVDDAKKDLKFVIENLKYDTDFSPRDLMILAEAHETLSKIYKSEDNIKIALDEIITALGFAKLIKDRYKQYYIELLSTQGLYYLTDKDFQRAEYSFKEAYDLFGDPVDGHGLFICYLVGNRLEEAEKLIIEVFEAFFQTEYLFLTTDFYIATNNRQKADDLLKVATDDIFTEDDKEDLIQVENYKKTFKQREVTIQGIIDEELNKI